MRGFSVGGVEMSTEPELRSQSTLITGEPIASSAASSAPNPVTASVVSSNSKGPNKVTVKVGNEEYNVVITKKTAVQGGKRKSKRQPKRQPKRTRRAQRK